MQKMIYSLVLLIVLIAGSCATTKHIDRSDTWTDVIVSEDMTIYVDTTSIKREGSMLLAREKRLFEPAARQEYINLIKEKYTKLGNPGKADAWADFSYNIYTSEYDCANKRLRILSIEDYDSQGVRIAKTTTGKDKLKWLYVDTETVRDYTFFFVCDYEN